MNWMDVVTIIILTVSSLYGLATGLIFSLVKIASVVLAFVVARVYYSTLTNYIINNTGVYESISIFINSRIDGLVVNGHDLIGDVTYETIETLNLPKVIANNITTSVGNLADGVSNMSMTNVLTTLIINSISIILIFIIVKVLVMFLGKILDKFASIPIINEFNKLGGFIFGLLKGALIVFVITALMLPLASLSPDNYIIETLQQSAVTKIFYDYNLILYLFNEILFNVGM